jgi:hypothetical protein
MILDLRAIPRFPMSSVPLRTLIEFGSRDLPVFIRVASSSAPITHCSKLQQAVEGSAFLDLLSDKYYCPALSND